LVFGVTGVRAETDWCKQIREVYEASKGGRCNEDDQDKKFSYFADLDINDVVNEADNEQLGRLTVEQCKNKIEHSKAISETGECRCETGYWHTLNIFNCDKRTFCGMSLMTDNGLRIFNTEDECKKSAGEEEKRRGGVGMPNPASFFCVDMGYQNVGGMCVNGESRCNEWAFFMGECRLNGSGSKPHLYLERKSEETKIGETMMVTVGIDSKDRKIVGADVMIKFNGSLNLEKAEMVDESLVGYRYDRNNFYGKINNETGVYDVTLVPPSEEYVGLMTKTAKGPVVNLTFRRTDGGLPQVYFACRQNTVRDSNIISDDAIDIISCGDNLNLIGMAGDADWDWNVGFKDLLIWKGGYLYKEDMRADFDRSKEVDFADLKIWKDKYLLYQNN
jgi:putative hemolysin